MSVSFDGTRKDDSVSWGCSMVRLPNGSEDDPGFNLSNTNAGAFLRLLEVPSARNEDGLCGSLPIVEMVRLTQKARASFDYRVDALVREPLDVKGARGPRLIVGGIDEAYFQRRLTEFENLLADLIEVGADTVSWG